MLRDRYIPKGRRRTVTDDQRINNPEKNRWGLVKAKTRDWSEEEVKEALEYVKREIPQEWAELEQLELTTGDLNGSRAIGIQFAALSELHPECEPYELSQLEDKIRDIRRINLGLD